jgi:SAM-dependent methyltransferase
VGGVPDSLWDDNYYSDNEVMNHYLMRYSGFQKIIEIVSRLPGTRGKWLDVGCGIGTLLQLAYQEGWDVYGIDISQKALELAQNRIKNAKLILGNVQENLDKIQDITVISMIDIFRFFECPKLILADLHNLLNEDGWILIREANASYLKKVRAREFWKDDITSIVSFQQWTPIALENALRLTGFRNVYSLPSPPFTETTNYYEKRNGQGIRTRYKSWMKLGLWHAFCVVNEISGGRWIVGPNFITLAQK